MRRVRDRPTDPRGGVRHLGRRLGKTAECGEGGHARGPIGEMIGVNSSRWGARSVPPVRAAGEGLRARPAHVDVSCARTVTL